MLGKEGIQRLLWVIPVLFLALFLRVPQADAWWGGNEHNHGYRHYSHYPYGRTVVTLPGKFISVSFGTGRFFYCDGHFYRHRDRDYVVVPAPIGVIVSTIPYGYHKVIIDQQTYYTYNGVYYTGIAGGYRVVDPPSTVVVEPETVSENIATGTAAAATDDGFTVNIPNTRGGYTAVILKRSGTGFVGPQGEFYPEFPKVEQLRAMYGK